MTFLLEIFSRLANMIIENFYIDPAGFRLEVKWGQSIRLTENKPYVHLKNSPENYPKWPFGSNILSHQVKSGQKVNLT